MTNYLKIWDNIRTSYWFVPIICITVSFVFSVISLIFDKANYSDDLTSVLFFSGTTVEARTILSSIAGFFISLIGIIFSLTIIVITLASNQFGSKLIRNFMHDHVTQLVLGLFTGTFVFCITTLYFHAKYIELIPRFSVSIAYFMAVVNIIFLVHFIHHIARSIQIPEIVNFIGAEFCATIKRVKCYDFHNSIKQNIAERECYHLKAKQSGYIQTIDIDNLTQQMEERDCICVFQKKPGDYVVSNIDELCCVYTKTPLDKQLLLVIEKSIIIGIERTPLQDPLFSLSQLTVIGTRLLSPSINDPHAVISVINQMTVCLSKFLEINHLFGDDCYNKPHNLHVPQVSFESCIDVTFRAIAYYAREHPSIMHHLMLMLLTLRRKVSDENNQSIKKMANDILRIADDQNYHSESYVAQMKQAYEEITITR